MSNYNIKFVGGSSASSVFSGISISEVSTDCKAYTEGLKSASETLEIIDTYDDFGIMKIHPEIYEAADESAKYGIFYDSVKHGNGNVITKGQENAVREFLQQRRGFGLLADPVGSGKTFEAGAVLSELAARGRISNMLLIVPSQVYDAWVEVIENKFGLGEGALYKYPKASSDERLPRNSELVKIVDNVAVPKKSIIVETEQFIKWDTNGELLKTLYDAVVVDEAHHLCDTGDEKYAGFMYRLSLLAEIKRKNSKPYCLLLSATPHSGNLEKMFRLWYFIRSSGGNPQDFNESLTPTKAFFDEMKVYLEEKCNGAKTVAEFINKRMLYELTNNSSEEDVAELHKFSSEYEDPEFGVADVAFDELTDYRKINIIKAFLAENPKIEARVHSEIAVAYHDILMRSIMVRNKGGHSNQKKKYPINIFFLPMKKVPSSVKLTKGGVLNVSELSDLGLEMKVQKDGKTMSAEEYVQRCYDGACQDARGRIISEALGNMGLTDADLTLDIERVGTLNFYKEKLSVSPKRVTNLIAPFTVGSDRAESVLSAKIDYLKKILKKHGNERVLVFFDYSQKGIYDVKPKVLKALESDPEIKDRLLVANARADYSDKFENNPSTVFMAMHRSATEGTNLQSSSVVVNFQMTIDPVAMEQRIGRVFRIGQRSDVTVYSLADMADLEGYMLTFFSKVKLLSADSGDATIIAGSSSGNMVAIRCPSCKKVKLMSDEEYQIRKDMKPGEHGALYCTEKQGTCYHPKLSPYGRQMTKINVNNFICDNPDCDAAIVRSTEGYTCLSGEGVLCDDIDLGERGKVYCHKKCVMQRCEKFRPDGPYGYCAVMAAIRNGVKEESELKNKCATCPKPCPVGCRFGDKDDAIRACAICDSRPSCNPRVISFDKKGSTLCPTCHTGHLKISPPSSFESYIRDLWKFDLDKKAFIYNLTEEINRVSTVSKILEYRTSSDN